MGAFQKPEQNNDTPSVDVNLSMWLGDVDRKWRAICHGDERLHQQARDTIAARIIIENRPPKADASTILDWTLAMEVAWSDDEKQKWPDRKQKRCVTVMTDEQREQVLKLAARKIDTRNKVFEAIQADGHMDEIYRRHSDARGLERVGAILHHLGLCPQSPRLPKRARKSDEQREREAERIAEAMC